MKDTAKRQINWPTFILVLFYLVAQIAIFVMFFFGAITFNNQKITFIEAINLIAYVFSINVSIWLKCIISLVFGISYIILFIIIFKNVISTLNHAFKVFFVSKSKAAINFSVDRISERCYSSFGIIIIFQMVAGLVGTNTIGNLMYLVLGMMIVVRAVECIIKEFLKEERAPIFDIIMNLIGNIMVSVIVCLLIFVLSQPYLNDFITGVKVLINGNINNNGGTAMLIYNLYISLVMPFLLILLSIFCMVLFENYIFTNKFYFADLKTSLIKTLSYAAIICFIYIIISVYFAGSFSMGILLSATMKNEYLPVIFLIAIWLVYAICYYDNMRYVQE